MTMDPKQNKIDAVLKSEVPLWERQQGESDKCFDYFCLYRDMGPSRSLQKVANAANKQLITMAQHSTQWNWKERTKAWTDWKDKERRETIIREVKEMAKRHYEESMMLQRCLILPAEALLKRMKGTSAAKIKDFNGIKLELLFDKVVKAAHEFSSIVDIERKSRGEPNDIVKSDFTSGGEPVKIILPLNQKKLKEDNDV